MIKLTSKATKYLWWGDKGFSFMNQDNMGLGPGRCEKMGIPETQHYCISFYKVPNGKKRSQPLELHFDSMGIYTGMYAYPSFKEEEKKKHERYAIKKLKNEGYLTEV